MSFKRIIIVAYRIPFKQVMIGDNPTIVQNSGGLVSAIYSLAKRQKQEGLLSADQKIIWFGYSESFFEETHKQGITNEDFEVVPIPLEKELNEKYYGGFCNSTIWPLFHYYPYLTQFDEGSYQSYKEANYHFFEQLRSRIQPGDFIWIHDYQLMLLPELIRKEFPDVQIGFFLHIPFPSYEIFRLLPHVWQHELLDGILGSDLIGFHTNDYTQYFLRTVSRVLGYSASNYTLMLKDRIVKADSFPISIDFEQFNSAFDDPEVRSLRKEFKKTFHHKSIVFSVDRLDYSKGLIHRLEGFEQFLVDHPEWRKKVTLVMVVVPSRDTILKYQEMKKDIEECIGRINGIYEDISWKPIIYMYRSLAFPKLVAWYTACDVALITPIRDGMNLVAKEFIASRKDKRGVLVLSEMAGASAELNGALLINPTAKMEISGALSKALAMNAEEQSSRIEKMQKRIKSYDVYRWSDDFTNQLFSIKSTQERLSVKMVNPKMISLIKEKFHSADHKLLLLDYDGTLVPLYEHPSQAIPSSKLKQTLQALARVKNCIVTIVSGRDHKTLLDWFGDCPFVLVSEHGASIDFRDDGITIKEHTENQEWKKKILAILQQYVDRCPGSFIENKTHSLAWHYRMSDPEFSFKRSRELVDELQSIIHHRYNLQILEGNKVMEIKNKGYDKGSATAKLIQKYRPDFIFAAGDDVTDENMFLQVPDNSWSIKIGLQTSVARYNLATQEELPELLDFLLE